MIEEIRREIESKFEEFLTRKFLIVESKFQSISLLFDWNVEMKFEVSTSYVGLGCRAGSNKTPVGAHMIAELIGSGVKSGTVFVSRKPTGEIWGGEKDNRDLILSRIIRLRGLQYGVNFGPGVDSFERYIYIHGTNHEELIGKPVSHGCVRMKNSDIVELFGEVEEGCFVFIC